MTGSHLGYFLYLYRWFTVTYKVKQKNKPMITNDKIAEFFCATDEFSKKFDDEIKNSPLLSSNGIARRKRAASMSDSEIMTILIMFPLWHF